MLSKVVGYLASHYTDTRAWITTALTFKLAPAAATMCSWIAAQALSCLLPTSCCSCNCKVCNCCLVAGWLCSY